MDRHRHTFIHTYTSTHPYNTHNELYRIRTVDMKQQFVATVWFSFFFSFFLCNTNQSIRSSSRSQESSLVQKRTQGQENTTQMGVNPHPKQAASSCTAPAVPTGHPAKPPRPPWRQAVLWGKRCLCALSCEACFCGFVYKMHPTAWLNTQDVSHWGQEMNGLGAAHCAVRSAQQMKGSSSVMCL